VSASMRRGAREANEESARAAWSRDMGQAIGSLAGLIAAINALTDRVERLEQQVSARDRAPKGGDPQGLRGEAIEPGPARDAPGNNHEGAQR